MSKKITISVKQAEQFNYMLLKLKTISKHYMTPEQIKRHSEGKDNYGIDYEEELEMSYENLQEEARKGAFKVRPIKIEAI